MIGTDDLQVWCTRTDVAADERVLSRDERARADRFRFPHHRLRWVAARALLRTVLSEALDCAPQDVRFRYSEYGKPVLHDDRVRFNLSHAGDLAVCVVCPTREVGIDVEQVRDVPDMDGVFRRIASQGEVRAWRALSARERQAAFFRCWTVKESCVKALGTGLTTPVENIEVLTIAGNPLVIECVMRTWRVFTFVPSAGYVAALSVEERARQPPPAMLFRPTPLLEPKLRSRGTVGLNAPTEAYR